MRSSNEHDSLVLEHVNLSVLDLEDRIRFFLTAFPQFRVRGCSAGASTPRWAHVGTDTQYIAIEEAQSGAARRKRGESGFNHAGFVVSDAQALRERMLGAGFREGYVVVVPAYPHRRREYFLDADGNEFEFVQHERNAYES